MVLGVGVVAAGTGASVTRGWWIWVSATVHLVKLDGRPCKAMADQLTTASKTRLLHRAGALRAGDLDAAERAERLHLGLS